MATRLRPGQSDREPVLHAIIAIPDDAEGSWAIPVPARPDRRVSRRHQREVWNLGGQHDFCRSFPW